MTWEAGGLGPSAAVPQQVPVEAAAVPVCYDTAAATDSDPAICERSWSAISELLKQVLCTSSRPKAASNR